MDSSSKLSYQRLKHENWLEEEDDIREHVLGGLRHPRLRGVHIKRRLRVKIPRLLTRKGSLLKIVLSKICRRLKESQAHFGDLFAGNYMFMQVTPTPLKKCFDDGLKSFVKTCDFDDGLSCSNYSVNPRINA